LCSFWRKNELNSSATLTTEVIDLKKRNVPGIRDVKKTKSKKVLRHKTFSNEQHASALLIKDRTLGCLFDLKEK